MCGIAGILMKNGAPPPPPRMLAAMQTALAHRGPDGSGDYHSGDTVMVQLRLAIIDLTSGKQPLYSADSAIIGNGEIYNYIELKSEKLPDQPFATGSDFEPILYLLARDGIDAIAELRGMYAFAMHSPGTGEVILARDPFGIKPLYYTDTEAYFAFASEPAALRAVIGTPALLPDKKRELLEMGYTTGRKTIFDGIHRMLSGEIFVLKNGTLQETRWIPVLPPPCPQKIKNTVQNFDDAVTAFDRVFENSVLLHQRSDVPYGMFLSGGLDSTAVLTMMARLNNRPVMAFTCGFDSAAVADERTAARAAAGSLGAQHVEIEFTEKDFWEMLPRVAHAMDDPVMDYATLPTFKLAAAARAKVKVILSGEGGDEVLGGYGRYRKARRPGWLGGGLRPIRGRFARLGILRDNGNAWQRKLKAHQKISCHPQRSNLQNAQAVDIAGWLPDDLLTKLDRCLMRHGIEGRTPFLDIDMMNFCFNLPDDFKIKDKQGKYLLRAWLQKYGPKNFDSTAHKRGFTVPVADWMQCKNTALGDLIARNLGVAEVAHAAAVKNLFNEPGSNKKQGFAKWSLLFYAVWHKIHMEGASPDTDVLSLLAQ